MNERAGLDYRSGTDERLDRPSPLADQDGPLTWRIVAARGGLLAVLAVVSLVLLLLATWALIGVYE